MKRIIHVDHSDFFRKQMKNFLEAEGFEVESYESAKEASFAIGAGSGDMVVMGLTFADQDGNDFVIKVIEYFSGPVLVVSSSIDKEKEEHLIKLGIKAAINKSGSWKDAIKPHLSALR